MPDECPDCERLKTKVTEEFRIEKRPMPPVEGSKRNYLPFRIDWLCPKCGHRVLYDLTDMYLSNPWLSAKDGDPNEGWNSWYLYCENEDCEVEFDGLEIKVEVDLKIRRKGDA